MGMTKKARLEWLQQEEPSILKMQQDLEEIQTLVRLKCPPRGELNDEQEAVIQERNTLYRKFIRSLKAFRERSIKLSVFIPSQQIQQLMEDQEEAEDEAFHQEMINEYMRTHG
jgi:hypothetical protein